MYFLIKYLFDITYGRKMYMWYHLILKLLNDGMLLQDVLYEKFSL